MIFIEADRVHALLDYPSVVKAFEQYHKEGIDTLDELLMEQPSPSGSPTHFFLRAAWKHQQALGVKLITVFPENETVATGLPSVQAVYVLFNGHNGQPEACIDGTALTYRKTAADSALGTRFLARDDVQTMLMVGAGAMAPHLIQAHIAVRPSIARVFVWNRTASRARALVDSLHLKDIEIQATEDLPTIVQEADLISCATMASTPLIKGQWLKPGAHLDLVGGFTNAMREADDEAVRRATVFVDMRATTISHCGDISGPIEAGVITADDIRADFFDLCQGKYSGRKRPEEITLFKNGGGGHLDLMTARFLLSRVQSLTVA
ncbi:MAG: ornithine cyclodeaminase family protein [Acidiferrobacterales bacterium]